MNDQPLNIVIPMAGAGSRFEKAGYHLPKPLIDVHGRPMIVRVLENLQIPGAQFILIVQKAHFERHQAQLQKIAESFPVRWVTVDGLTRGSAATVLAAHRLIQTDTPLLIANSDQWIRGGVLDFVQQARARNQDGSILTFTDKTRNPKWSFVAEHEGRVTQAVEKVPISDRATVGLYYFKRGRDFVDSTIDMIVNEKTSQGEFYTCPVYNSLVEQGQNIGFFDIQPEQMHGLGTPEDLQSFLQQGLL